MAASESTINFSSACPPLLTLCVTTMKRLELARANLKPVPSTLVSVANECFALHRALVKVQRFDLQELRVLEERRGQQVLDALEAFFLGCNMTMSAVHDLLEELRKEAVLNPGDAETESQNALKLKLQQSWREEAMKEFLVQIREYRSGVMDLLNDAQTDVAEFDKSSSTETENVEELDLAGRSDSSQQVRPSSVLSSDQGSLLDPSPPYAVSLHEVTTNYTYPAPTVSSPNILERCRIDAGQLADESVQDTIAPLTTHDLGQHPIVNGGEDTLVIRIHIMRARNLVAKEASGTESPYLVVTVGTRKKAIHKFDQNLSPESSAFFNIPLVGDALFKCVCLRKSVSENDIYDIGEFDLDVGDIFANGKAQQEPIWYKLKARRGGGRKTQVSGEIQLQFSVFDSANLIASPEEIMRKFGLVIVKLNIKRLMDI